MSISSNNWLEILQKSILPKQLGNKRREMLFFLQKSRANINEQADLSTFLLYIDSNWNKPISLLQQHQVFSISRRNIFFLLSIKLILHKQTQNKYLSLQTNLNDMNLSNYNDISCCKIEVHLKTWPLALTDSRSRWKRSYFQSGMQKYDFLVPRQN